ncbi:hypothetical protein ACRAWD_12955 [Caulobacter segnis]
MPPPLVVSSEGSAMYGTTDLATILDRRQSLDPHLILYCVDYKRQATALRDRVPRRLSGRLRRGGRAGAHRLRHHERDQAASPLPFQDPGRRRPEAARPDRDGPREGPRAPAAKEAGLGAELSEAQFEENTHGPQGRRRPPPLKCADLQSLRRHLLRLRPRPLHQLRGQDRPRTCWPQSVRIKSVLRKAAEAGATAGPIVIGEQAERDLAMLLDAFEGALQEAYDKEGPQLLRGRARLQKSWPRPSRSSTPPARS